MAAKKWCRESISGLKERLVALDFNGLWNQYYPMRSSLSYKGKFNFGAKTTRETFYENIMAFWKADFFRFKRMQSRFVKRKTLCVCCPNISFPKILGRRQ